MKRKTRRLMSRMKPECIAVMTAYPNGSYPDTDTMSITADPGTYRIFFAATEEDSTGTITVKPGLEE